MSALVARLSMLVLFITLAGSSCKLDNAAAKRDDKQPASTKQSGSSSAPSKQIGALSAQEVAKPGLWQPLVERKAVWKLINYNEKDGDENDAVLVENYDLRQVGPVAVARFRWKTSGGQDLDDRDHLPRQVALLGNKVWFLPLDANDNAVSRAPMRAPTFTDPQPDVQPTRKNHWQWAQTTTGKHGSITCIGHMRPQGDDCEDTCSGMVCFSAREGIVAVEGTSSPSFEYYALKGYADLK